MDGDCIGTCREQWQVGSRCDSAARKPCWTRRKWLWGKDFSPCSSKGRPLGSRWQSKGASWHCCSKIGILKLAWTLSLFPLESEIMVAHSGYLSTFCSLLETWNGRSLTHESLYDKISRKRNVGQSWSFDVSLQCLLPVFDLQVSNGGYEGQRH